MNPVQNSGQYRTDPQIYDYRKNEKSAPRVSFNMQNTNNNYEFNSLAGQIPSI
jgi:hypothetical protein